MRSENSETRKDANEQPDDVVTGHRSSCTLSAHWSPRTFTTSLYIPGVQDFDKAWLPPPSCPKLQVAVRGPSGTGPIQSLAMGYMMNRFISIISSGVIALQHLNDKIHFNYLGNFKCFRCAELGTGNRMQMHFWFYHMGSALRHLRIVVRDKITRPRTFPWLGRKQMPRGKDSKRHVP